MIRGRDVYICPAGHEMSFRNWRKHHGKMMKPDAKSIIIAK
jgi:hypothetical protein